MYDVFYFIYLFLPPSPYTTSPVRLGVLQKVNEKCERFLERRFPRVSIMFHTLRKGMNKPILSCERLCSSTYRFGNEFWTKQTSAM